MKLSAMWFSSLIVAGIPLALSVAVEARNARGFPVTYLRGGLADVNVALARLDPGWWKATTATTTAAPAKNATNATEKDEKKAPAPGPPPSIFDVKIETCTPFLNMPGTFRADAEYWKNECKSVPSAAKYVKLTMGDVTDFFRPKDSKNMCDMFTSPDQHEWSGDGSTFVTPTASTVGLGGSAEGWLTKESSSDKRDTPSFWGVINTTAQTGGCCHSKYETTGKAWSLGFSLQYCGIPKSLAPICTPLTAVAGTFSADKDFWAETCKTIPMTASFVKVAMGDSIDYFRPPTGKSYCDMLTGNDLHKWSKDGYTNWITPTYESSGLGGSAAKGVNTSDARSKVSFWGSDTKTDTGGCCYSSLSDDNPGFGRSFTMSYCEIPTAPPTSQLMAMLHENEALVQGLENTLSDIHTRLLTAEQVDVDAAGNVSLARSGMNKLALKARNEAEDLKLVTTRSSISGSKLDAAENTLTGAVKRISADADKAKATKQIVEKTASPSGLQAQDTLNEKIWKLLDPSNKDSLDAVEKRVRNMEKAEETFKGVLKGEIKTVLVTKMRRSTNRLRRAIHKLGTAGNKVSSRTLGAVESGAALGSDLGLDED